MRTWLVLVAWMFGKSFMHFEPTVTEVASWFAVAAVSILADATEAQYRWAKK